MPSPENNSKGTIVLDHIVILVPYSFLALTGVHKPNSSSSSSSQAQPFTGSGGGGGDGANTTTTQTRSSPPQKHPLQNLFTFSPGGRHSDGLTENVLVLLPNGVYLEFIAFTPETSPEDREKHKWGRCEEGSVVDWAVTVYHSGDDDNGGGNERGGRARRDYDAVIQPVIKEILDKHNHEGGGGGGGGGRGKKQPIIPGPFVPGGRQRPDGVELKWAVVPAVRASGSSSPSPPPSSSSSSSSSSEARIRPGQAPFVCLDETPRRLRVPYRHTDPSFTEHPVTGAVGIARVEVKSVVTGSGGDVARFYDAMFGREEGDVWKLSTPEGARLHPHGEVRLQGDEEEEGRGDDDVGEAVLVSFYTDKAELAGMKVEGEMEGCKGVVFELVGV